MPAKLSPFVLGCLCGITAVALGLCYLVLADAPPRYLVLNLAATVIGLLGLGIARSLPSAMVPAPRMIALALALLLLVTALFGIEAAGARRWFAAGSLLIQPAFIAVPAIAVCHALRADKTTALAVALAAIALAIQPDRGMAGALFAGAAGVLLLDRRRASLAAAGAAAIGFAAALARPDLGGMMPHVDQILFNAFDSGLLAGLCVVGGVIVLMAPGLIGLAMRRGNRALHAAYAGVWVAIVLAAALGNYPTPLVGYGGTAIVGYFWALAALLRPDQQTARRGDQQQRRLGRPESDRKDRMLPA